jgi:hypothetical protein
MSFAGRLIHKLAIVTPTFADNGHGQAVPGTPAATAVPGLVQPKTARELATTSQAGAEISTHTVFLEPRAIADGAWIRFDPDDGRRFDITGIRAFEFGRRPHLEVDARMVKA